MIIYSRASVIDHSSSLSVIELASGESVRKWPPVTVETLFDDLRSGMYKDGKGTWFSLEYVITRPGKFKVRYNYDEDPHILFPTAWGFTNDLKYFPRDEENIPGWLHEKLREEAEGRATG
ncbi:immunity protein YezG family protein [Nocardiopsis akebiae]|nr:immunity protein YezG family protein [Nocardiopsis akebiae]